jgi:hypothetical protein
MTLTLEVQTLNPELVQSTQLPSGVTLEHKETKTPRDGGLSIVVFVLTLAKDVAAGMVAAWLYDWLKGRASKVRLNGKMVRIDKAEIEAAIDPGSNKSSP